MNALARVDDDWTAVPASDWKHAGRRAFADTCYILLRVAGWMAMTLLATLGVGVVFFLMLGDFTALGFFSQVANLCTRFVAADASRRAAFGDQLFIVWGIAFVAVALLRAKLIVAIIISTKGSRHG